MKGNTSILLISESFSLIQSIFTLDCIFDILFEFNDSLLYLGVIILLFLLSLIICCERMFSQKDINSWSIIIHSKNLEVLYWTLLLWSNDLGKSLFLDASTNFKINRTQLLTVLWSRVDWNILNWNVFDAKVFLRFNFYEWSLIGLANLITFIIDLKCCISFIISLSDIYCQHFFTPCTYFLFKSNILNWSNTSSNLIKLATNFLKSNKS